MKDLDAPNALRVTDFPRSFRFRMVRAYPVISEIADVHEASRDEIDAGFARCLDNRHLRRVAELQHQSHGGWLSNHQKGTTT